MCVHHTMDEKCAEVGDAHLGHGVSSVVSHVSFCGVVRCLKQHIVKVEVRMETMCECVSVADQRLCGLEKAGVVRIVVHTCTYH